ncbi:CAP domain-containing protein [Oceanobacillus alkalisoli]|uniref:CAP domain-containing protein n=1 Tax=Oceanobacillus alkalisoli TaxID=2925113 RepID=UPI001F11E81F|nr:CAP domain-containing protein [Oceanobacillus alkalisoli]MCF3944565.1 CAP domain-containing protein [Oceanobacillus alkalisoli]
MAFLRRLIVLLVVVGLFWYFYGDSFKESGVSGVFQDIQSDIYRISEHPVVSNTVSWIDQEIRFLSGKVSESLRDQDTSSPLKQPDLSAPSDHLFSIHNIELGDTRADVEAQIGEPERATRNEYGVDWVTYHNNYQHFMMVAYDDHDLVSGLYTNQDLLTSSNGITFESTRDEVLSVLPKPLETIRKGLLNYEIQNNGEFHTFDIDESYTTIFYDVHQENKVTAILMIDKQLEKQKKNYFGMPSDELREGFEYQLFDLTNASRVKHGLSLLAWEDSALETVRAHSQDMAANNYFSHTNLEGMSPFDRLTEDAIAYRRAGENLAAGQQSSIFAHEGLMNSLGHRENKLQNSYQTLAVGVAFNEDSHPFYTENYIAKN